MDACGLGVALVANGVTFLGGSLVAMLAALCRDGGELLRIATAVVPDVADFGGVQVDERGRVVRSVAKGAIELCAFKAGPYRIHRSALPTDILSSLSLETVALRGHALLGAVSAAGVAVRFTGIKVPKDCRRYCHQHDQFR